MSGKIYANVEMTDTFGGELNYCWVRRISFVVPGNASNRLVLKRARKALSFTGKLRNKLNYGDELRYDFDGACVAICITFSDEAEYEEIES